MALPEIYIMTYNQLYCPKYSNYTKHSFPLKRHLEDLHITIEKTLKTSCEITFKLSFSEYIYFAQKNIVM